MAKSRKVEGAKEYVLKAGFEHNGITEDEKRHVFVGGQQDNDRVWLTDNQYNSFKDKFESLEEQKDRQKAQVEIAKLQREQNSIREKLAEQGISLDEFLTGEVTIKKPDPSPSIGTQEPTPPNVTPPPVGSTSNPTAGSQPAPVKTK